jgi:hypothetical protein
MSAALAVWVGQGTAATVPKYWQATPAASDDGVAFGLVATSLPLYPMGRGGEAVFHMAHLSIYHLASAVLRVTPIVEPGLAALAAASGVLTLLPVVFTLAQLTEPAMHVASFPLVARLTRSGGGVTRVNVRGVGCSLLVESVGAIGNGVLAIDSAVIEWTPVRKAAFELVTA